MDQLNVGIQTADVTAVRMHAGGVNDTKEQTVLRATYSRKEGLDFILYYITSYR